MNIMNYIRWKQANEHIVLPINKISHIIVTESGHCDFYLVGSDDILESSLKFNQIEEALISLNDGVIFNCF